MYGSRIFATPFTITGSIGVIGGWFYNSGLKEKLHLTNDKVSIGQHADLMHGTTFPFLGRLPDRNLNDIERNRIKTMILDMYQQFMKKVSRGRNLQFDKVEEIAQGRVWTGYQALSRGLIDEQGSLFDAIDAARLLAKVPACHFSVKEYHKPGWNAWDLIRLRYPATQEMITHPDYQYWKFRIEKNGNPLIMLPELYQLSY